MVVEEGADVDKLAKTLSVFGSDLSALPAPRGNGPAAVRKMIR
jgi:hypothetical protein